MAGRVDATGGAAWSADPAARYVMGPEIGRGGHGRVYKATTTAAAAAVGLPAGMEVAVKVGNDWGAYVAERELQALRKVSRCSAKPRALVVAAVASFTRAGARPPQRDQAAGLVDDKTCRRQTARHRGSIIRFRGQP